MSFLWPTHIILAMIEPCGKDTALKTDFGESVRAIVGDSAAKVSNVGGGDNFKDRSYGDGENQPDNGHKTVAGTSTSGGA